MEFSDHWKAQFRHSAGRLGSKFLTALAGGKLIGWKAKGSSEILVPPRETGPEGEWIELSGAATLLGIASEPQANGNMTTWLGWVSVDGADTPLFARISADRRPAPGARMQAAYRDDSVPMITTLYFQCHGKTS